MPAPTQNTYETRPTGGSDFSAPTPITHRWLFGSSGEDYWINVDGTAFLSASDGDVSLSGNSNVLALAKGGTLTLDGTHNAVLSNGNLVATDDGAGGNLFVLGSNVSTFGGTLAASDQVYLAGFTQQDISAGFAHPAQHSPQNALVTITNAAGRSLQLGLSEPSGVALPTAAQFHGIG